MTTCKKYALGLLALTLSAVLPAVKSEAVSLNKADVYSCNELAMMVEAKMNQRQLALAAKCDAADSERAWQQVYGGNSR